MKFSSPYNKSDRLCDRDLYWALDEKGRLIPVVEGYVPDNRHKDGKRLIRNHRTTSQSLIGTALYVLPEDFDHKDSRWIMLQLCQALEDVDQLREDVFDLKMENSNFEDRLTDLERNADL